MPAQKRHNKRKSAQHAGARQQATAEMSADVYRPGDNRDRDRDAYDSYDRRPRYNDRYDDRDAGRHNDDGRHPYEWYRSRSHSRSPPRRRSPRRSRSPPRRRNDDVYQFGGGYPAQSGDRARDDFTFRSNDQREFRNDQPPPRDAPRGPRRGGNRQQGGRFDRRGGWQRKVHKAADRKILQADDREGTPERLEGMIEGQSRFKDVDDLFDSEQESDDESAMDLESPDGDAEPPAKRKKVIEETPPPQPEKPKWSNPDPYFILPPLDESRHKRKDVVQLLRKAKAEPQDKASTANAVSRNADFIGFGDEDEDEDKEEGEEGEEEELILGTRIIAPATLSEEGEIDDDDDGWEPMDGSRDPPLASTSFRNGTVTQAAQSSATTATDTPGGASFSHLKHLHNMAALQTNGISSASKAVSTQISTNQIATPQSAIIEPETALEDARQVLAELNAEDNAQPQSSNKRGGPPHGKKRKAGADGEITSSWKEKNRASATPWHIDHSMSPDTAYWLHQEICDFYDFIKPQQYEARIREDLVNRLQDCVDRACKGSILYTFGSFAQGIYLPTSDMDLVLYTPPYQRGGYPWNPVKKLLYQVRSQLVRAGIIEKEMDGTVIAGAKVPIIKFTDVTTGLACDISVDNDSGIRALTTFEKWIKQWPFLPKLLSVLKQWLLMRGMNEVFNGGLGGFSLTCMLVNMLQQRADGQTQNLDGSAYLGELLLDFLDLYGNKFNMDRVGIDMPTAELFDKNEWRFGKDDRWTIMDPNNATNDLSGGSHMARLIQTKFSQSHKTMMELVKRMDTAPFVLRKGTSFLRVIIGGNYERVVLQRSIIREVHRRNIGPVEG